MIRILFLIVFSFPLAAGLCRYHIKQVERDLNVPTDTLAAIGQVESGKYCAYRKCKEPWPWTVYAQGKGQFFQTKTQAERYIQKLLAQGETNIDIGCMQLNWQYHGHQFSSISDMLHPRKNVEYAGDLLKQHYHTSQDWDTAVGNYHSKTPEHHKKYRTRIELARNELATRKARPAARAMSNFKKWRPVPVITERQFIALENAKRRNRTWLR